MTIITIAGKGTYSLELPEGTTVIEALVAAAMGLGVEETVVRHLSPVVDSKEAALNDVVPQGARQVTGIRASANG